MNTIPNEPIQDDKAIQKLKKAPAFEIAPDLDQMLSGTDLEKCEKAVQFCQSAIEATNLAVALAVRHIVVNGLYKEQYDTHTEYFENSESRLKMSKQKASRYLKCGIAYYEYRMKLDDAGFRPDGDYSKLEYLTDAIDLYGEADAIQALCSMKAREYKEYARPTKPKIEYTKQNIKAEVSTGGIAVEGKDVITVKQVQQIIDEGSEPYLIGLYSQGEKAAVNRFLKQFREKK